MLLLSFGKKSEFILMQAMAVLTVTKWREPFHIFMQDKATYSPDTAGSMAADIKSVACSAALLPWELRRDKELTWLGSQRKWKDPNCGPHLNKKQRWLKWNCPFKIRFWDLYSSFLFARGGNWGCHACWYWVLYHWVTHSIPRTYSL